MRSTGLNPEKMLLKPRNTKIHWLCIFLTMDCSFTSPYSDRRERAFNRKAAEAFPLYMKSRLRISTEALKHLLLYRTQCSDTPVICFSSSRGSHKSWSALGAVGQIPQGKVAVGREKTWQHSTGLHRQGWPL